MKSKIIPVFFIVSGLIDLLLLPLLIYDIRDNLDNLYFFIRNTYLVYPYLYGIITFLLFTIMILIKQSFYFSLLCISLLFFMKKKASITLYFIQLPFRVLFSALSFSALLSLEYFHFSLALHIFLSLLVLVLEIGRIIVTLIVKRRLLSAMP